MTKAPTQPKQSVGRVFDPEAIRPSQISVDVWKAACKIVYNRPSTPRPTYQDMLGGMITLTYEWEETPALKAAKIMFVVVGGETDDPLYRPVWLEFGTTSSMEGKRLMSFHELETIMNILFMKRQKPFGGLSRDETLFL